MRAIETTDLSKHFSSGKIKALDNVTLAVDTGHIFGLLGPNGAGKTTLVKIMLGILNPTSGSATLLEHPLDTIEIKERVGYLPENHRYPDFLKGGEVLDFYARLAGVPARTIENKKKRLLKMVDMHKWESTRIRKYSKGMMQRLGLAQAMVNDPDVLFLDEPTDGVDPFGRKQIRDVLHRVQDVGKTVFLNSHLLSEVEMICDQVAILDKGRLIRTGTVEELTSPSRTFRFQTSGVSPDLLTALKSFSLKIDCEDNYLTATCANQEKLNGIVDVLRKHHVDIKSIVPHKRSLEASFIEILKKDVVAE